MIQELFYLRSNVKFIKRMVTNLLTKTTTNLVDTYNLLCLIKQYKLKTNKIDYTFENIYYNNVLYFKFVTSNVAITLKYLSMINQ